MMAVCPGLWQSATETASDLLARLAIVHMVHEARGRIPSPVVTVVKRYHVLKADMSAHKTVPPRAGRHPKHHHQAAQARGCRVCRHA